MEFEITKDCDLRGYFVGGLSEIQKEIHNAVPFCEGEIFIPFKLLRLLWESHFPHRKNWQEWRDFEEQVLRRQEQIKREVAEYKKLDPNRPISLNSSVADIIAKSEQLAETEMQYGMG